MGTIFFFDLHNLAHGPKMQQIDQALMETIMIAMNIL
jgi:hypothetical protein